ncbi:hypothetical protein [Shewanella algae]|uniref:hypothetical protein n=1 Tax=Shewanella algae TaxID=38313 RepID=UPI0005CCED03|nr:hypothetical protein [Shewanella algae]
MNNQTENKPHQLSLTIQTGIQGKAAKYCGLILENHRNTFQINGNSFANVVEQVRSFPIEPGTSKALMPVLYPFNLKPVEKLTPAKKPTVPGEYSRAKCHDKVSFIVLDFDGKGTRPNEIKPIEMHIILKESGLNHWIYTTSSHDAALSVNRFRVLLPMVESFNHSSIRERKGTLKKYFNHLIVVNGRVSTLDNASFSENQGFALPTAGAFQYLCTDQSPFNLMRIAKDPVAPKAPATEKGWSEDGDRYFAERRQATVARWKLTAGSRDQQLLNLALNLTRVHAQPAEVKAALDGVIRSQVADKDKRAEHLNKVDSKVAAARAHIASKVGFAAVPSDFARVDQFVPLEQVEQATLNALESNDDHLLLNVTCGGGKTHTAIQWAAEKVKTQNQIIGFAVKTASDAEVIAGKFRDAGVIDVRIVEPRSALTCVNFEVYESKRRGDELDRSGKGDVDSDRGATAFCKSHCPARSTCVYANQTAGLNPKKQGTALVYKHAHLFGKVGIHDKGFPSLDVLIVDEDVTNTFLNEYKDALSLEQLINQIPEGGAAEFFTALFEEGIQDSPSLDCFLNRSRHSGTARLIVDRLKRSGLPALRHLAECIDERKGSNRLYIEDGFMWYLNRAPFAPTLNKSARVIFLDGTGSIHKMRGITGLDLIEKQIDVDISAHSEVIQCHKDGLSFSKACFSSNKGLAEAISALADDLGAFELTTKSAAGVDSSIYFFNQRGRNDLENVDTLIVSGTPNPPESVIKDLSRLTYQHDPVPLSWEKITVLEVGRGRGAVNVYAKKQVYADPRVRGIRDSLVKSELLQAIERARLIRRTAANPVRVYVFSNEILPLTITRTCSLSDIGIRKGTDGVYSYVKPVKRVVSKVDLKRLQDSTFEGVKPVEVAEPEQVEPEVVDVAEVPEPVKPNQRAMDALERFAGLIKAAIAANGGEPLKWKQGNVIKATGGKVTTDTWKSQSGKELDKVGLEVVEQRVKVRDRYKMVKVVRLIDVAA